MSRDESRLPHDASPLTELPLAEAEPEPETVRAPVEAAASQPSSEPTTLPQGVDPKKLYRRGLERSDSFKDTLRMARAASEAFRWLNDEPPASAPASRRVRPPQPSSDALGRADDEGMTAPRSER